MLAAHLVAQTSIGADPEPQPWREQMTASIVSALVNYNAAASIRDHAERSRVQSEALQDIQRTVELVAKHAKGIAY